MKPSDLQVKPKEFEDLVHNFLANTQDEWVRTAAIYVRKGQK